MPQPEASPKQSRVSIAKLLSLSRRMAVLYLAPHTPGGLQVVLVDLVDSIWSPPGFHKNSHIATEFSGVHLESTWSPLESIWTPFRLHVYFTKTLDKCYEIICTLYYTSYALSNTSPNLISYQGKNKVYCMGLHKFIVLHSILKRGEGRSGGE